MKPIVRGPGAALQALSIVVCLMVASAPAAAQFACTAAPRPLSLGPAYLDEVDAGRALGLAGAARWCHADYDPRPRLPRALYLGVQADGAVPFARVSLPHNLQGSGWLGMAWSLTERLPDDPTAPLDEVGPAFRFDYGVLGLGGRLQYEAGTDFAEQALAGAAEVRWVNPSWPLAPSLVLSIAAVLPLASEVRDGLGAGHEVHGRLTAQAYWLVPIVASLELELDGRVFAAFGLDEIVAETGLNQGAFADARLAWEVGDSIGRLRLDRIWIGYAIGRQPTDSRSRTALAIGLRVDLI